MNLVTWHPHALFILLFLTLGLLTALVNFISVKRFDQYPETRVFPRVSILVPARNEAGNIESCVSSLLEQDYPDYEVIVIDDHSTDDTLARLERLQKGHPCLQTLRSAPLPPGWYGKHWACHQLYQAARGELLLFTDADTVHKPGALRASVSAMLAERADLVTAFPHEQVLTWGEKLLVPFIGFGILTFIPVWLVQKFHWKALAVTIGQFMLFKRQAYEAIGGFEAVRMEIVDDICLGKNLIAWGGEWRLLNGTRHVSCRMYRGFWQAVNGLGKSLFAVFDYRVLPYLTGWLMVGFSFLAPVMALFSHWLRHPVSLISPEAASLAVVLSLGLWTTAYRRFRFPAYLVLLYPLTMFLFLLVVLRSLVTTATGTATWKERLLEPPGLRWL